MENPLRKKKWDVKYRSTIVQCHFNPVTQVEPSKVTQLLQLYSKFITPISKYNLKVSTVTALCCSAGQDTFNLSRNTAEGGLAAEEPECHIYMTTYGTELP